MRKNDDAFNSLLDIPAIFVVWLPTKQRMADNGWMYSGRVSVTNRSPEWIWKTQMVVKQLACYKGNGSGILPMRSLPEASPSWKG